MARRPSLVGTPRFETAIAIDSKHAPADSSEGSVAGHANTFREDRSGGITSAW